jgi:hypothetical protein
MPEFDAQWARRQIFCTRLGKTQQSQKAWSIDQCIIEVKGEHASASAQAKSDVQNTFGTHLQPQESTDER